MTSKPRLNFGKPWLGMKIKLQDSGFDSPLKWMQ